MKPVYTCRRVIPKYKIYFCAYLHAVCVCGTLSFGWRRMICVET